MVNITIVYQPFSFLKYTRRIEGLFPSSFQDLKPNQFVAITALINQKISDITFLKIMTGIPKFRIKKLEDYYRYQLMLLFEPFTEVKPHNAFIIPSITTPSTVFFSPKEKLSGMTFAQFIFIENYFTDYQNDKNNADLHKFVASLYLPRLHRFDENKILEWSGHFAKVKPEILEAVIINYVLIKEWLSQAYPMVFQHTEEDELEKKTHKISNHNSGWLKIYENIVGDDLINHDRYSMLPLHNVLRWMTTKIKENIKRK